MDTLQDAPVRPPWLFTSESAKANRQISLKNQAERLAKAQALATQKPEAVNDAQPIDPLAGKLARVQDELVAKMTGNDDPKEITSLARALRDVRETLHMITGQPKPGSLKPTSGRRSDRGSNPTPNPRQLNPRKPQGETIQTSRMDRIVVSH